MAGRPGFEKRQNIFLAVVFSAFLAVVLYTASVPIGVGDHACGGALYDYESGEALFPAEVTLSGKRSYSANPSLRSLEGRLSVTVDGRVWYDGQFSARHREDRDGWTHFTYLNLVSTGGVLSSYWEDGLLCRRDYGDLAFPLLGGDGRWYLLAAAEKGGADRVFSEAKDALGQAGPW